MYFFTLSLCFSMTNKMKKNNTTTIKKNDQLSSISISGDQVHFSKSFESIQHFL